MAIKRADIYEHQNPNLPIVDAINVAGAFLTVADVIERDNRPIAKRSRLINVLGVGLCLYTNASFDNVFWTNTANWLNLTELLDNKVDKETGKGLSQENFTTAEKTKLAGLEPSKYKGNFGSLVALQTAFSTADAGDFADVDEGVGNDVVRYVWDATNTQWVAQAGTPTTETATSIKTKYESNSDTNAFTDLEKTKLAELGSYTTLTDKPDLTVYALISQLFSGNYNDLINKPNLSVYALLSQLFSGNYNDLTNKPDLTYLLSGTSDSFKIDSDKVLHNNIATYQDTFYYNKTTPILPLAFEPVSFTVFVDGVLLESINYHYQNTHDLEILSNIKNGCRIDVFIKHFVDAEYNSNRANYVNGEITNVISCIDSMDVVFLVDFTSSMGGTIDTVKNNILTILNTIETESNNDFRISIILFDEITDSAQTDYETKDAYINLPANQKRVIAGTASNNIYITNIIAFSSDKTLIQNEISKLNTTDFPLGNGIGAPEPSDVAISEVIENNFAGTFRSNANKSIILFTDNVAGGLDDTYSTLDADELARLKTLLISKGITFTVMYNGGSTNVEYQQMANETQGKYVNGFSQVTEITTAIEQICSEI